MGRLLLHGDLVSQPVRAVILFCRVTGIDIKLVQTVLHKHQHRSRAFKKDVYRLGKMPVMQEGDFFLPESPAILAYLANTNSVPDHWYPADARRRARVDAAMHWHHSNVRQVVVLLMHRVTGHIVGIKKDPIIAQAAEDNLLLALKGLEVYWLAGRDFVAGDEISIADLLMVTELDALPLLDAATEGRSQEEIFAPFPKVRDWMQRVSQVTAPHHQEVSLLAMETAARFAEKAKAQSKL